MSLADGRALLPSLETVPVDSAGDAAALARLVGWCGRYSPWTAVDGTAPEGVIGGDGSIWLDVTGCTHLFGGDAAMLADLTSRLGKVGFGVRAAVADTPGAAWAAARFVHPDVGAPWVVVAPGEIRTMLRPLPTAALRLTAKTVAALDTLGLRCIGDLVPLPRASLAARFGGEVAKRLDQALGCQPEPLSPIPAQVPHFARLAFAEPVGRTEDLAYAVIHLLDELCAGLETAGHGARRLLLTLYEPDGRIHRFRIGTSRPSRAAAHLARLFAEHLDAVETKFGIEAMTLMAPVTEMLGPVQAALDSGPVASADDPDALIDRLSNRLGANRVIRFSPQESHIPERAAHAAAALISPSKQADPAAWPEPSRPLRLLSRPEAIEATAPVPDDPPVMFRWRRVLYRVARAEGPERIVPEWWRDDTVADADGLRDYYRVEDTAGHRFWLYREGLYRADVPPAWYMHGIFG